MDQLAALATMRSGQMPLFMFLTMPHNEHLLPLVRLLFMAATWLSGIDAWAARIAVILLHVGGAMACALLTSYVSRNRLAPWLAGTIYAGAGGFSGTVIWEITAANFSIAATFLYFAFVALAGPAAHRKAALSASLALVLASSMGMAAVAVVAATSIAVYVFLADPKLVFSRWRAILAHLTLCAAILFGSSLMVLHWGGSPKPRLSGLLQGGWLILTVPFRFLTACLPREDRLLVQNDLHTAVWSVAAWVILLISSYWLERRARILLSALWAGDCVFALLIGLGRWSISPFQIFLTDRYYYFFLLPLSIHASAVLAAWISRLTANRRAAKPLAAIVVAFAIAGGLVGSRSKFNLNIPWTIWRLHERAFSQGRALIRLIAARASAPRGSRLMLSDGEIPFEGVHKDGIKLSTLFFTEFPNGLDGVNWVYDEQPIAAVDAAVENQSLDGWAQSLGATSPVCVVGGVLQEIRATGWIDYRHGGFRASTVRGFHGWEGWFRWMSRSGTVRLQGPGGGLLVIRAHAPLSLMRRKWPDLRGLRADVQVDSTPVGQIFIDREDEQEFEIQLPAEVRSRIASTHGAEVTLRSELVWTGADVNVRDDRELSLALIAIGFRPPAAATSELSATDTCSARLLKADHP